MPGQGAGKRLPRYVLEELLKCPCLIDELCDLGPLLPGLGFLSYTAGTGEDPSPGSVFCDSWHPCSSWLSSTLVETSGQGEGYLDLCLPLPFPIKVGCGPGSLQPNALGSH